MRKLKAYLRPSLTTFCRNFFWNARKKNREEYEPVTVSSFQHSIHRYLREKKHLFNILKDNEFEKSRKSLQRSKSPLVTSTGKEKNRKLLRPSRKTKRMSFLKQENSTTPIQLRFKELCGIIDAQIKKFVR